MSDDESSSYYSSDSDESKNDIELDEEEKEEDNEEDEKVEEQEEEELEDEIDEIEDNGEDDMELIKVNTSNKIEVGDLKKITRTTLKKRFSKIQNISKNVKKYYKNKTPIERSSYNFLNNGFNIKKVAKSLLGDNKTFHINSRDINKNINIIYQLSLLRTDVSRTDVSRTDVSRTDVECENKYDNIDVNNLFENYQFKQQQIENEKTCRYLLEKPQIYESENLQCSKCKSRKVVYYSLQTRRSDEPMTNFYTCTICGKKWKN